MKCVLHNIIHRKTKREKCIVTKYLVGNRTLRSDFVTPTIHPRWITSIAATCWLCCIYQGLVSCGPTLRAWRWRYVMRMQSLPRSTNQGSAPRSAFIGAESLYSGQCSIRLSLATNMASSYYMLYTSKGFPCTEIQSI